MKDIKLQVKKDEAKKTYRVTTRGAGVSLPEAISLLKAIKVQGYVDLVEVTENGKVYWVLKR